jgi:lipoyl(octanoyl) transferase
MERLMIDSLQQWGVDAECIPGQTGVWTSAGAPEAAGLPVAEAKKIGSIGVHVNRGVTTHGFAINVNNDLQPFEWIVPCGIEGCHVTSLCRELGSEQDMGAFMDTVATTFGAVYEREPVAVDTSELDLGPQPVGS